MSDIIQLEAKMMREFGALHRKLDHYAERTELVSNRQLATDARVDNHAGRLRTVERREEERSEKEPGPNWRAESTGVYDVPYLAKKERERESDARALKRRAVGWVGSAVGAAILFLAGLLAAHLLH